MRKTLVMTALATGTFIGSGFGAVSGGYCHSAEYYREKRTKPVASTTSGLSERERIADKKLEAARLKLEAARINAGMGASSARPVTEKDLPENLKDFQPEHVEFVRTQAKSKVVKYQHMMGRMYVRGEGLPQNDERAADCFRVAYFNYNYQKSGDALRALISTGRIQPKDAKEKQRLGL